MDDSGGAVEGRGRLVQRGVAGVDDHGTGAVKMSVGAGVLLLLVLGFGHGDVVVLSFLFPPLFSFYTHSGSEANGMRGLGGSGAWLTRRF
jgi:hypothetical protein